MSFAGIATDGPLVLAIGASAAAGLVSFLSPCVLPLVPGYLSYVTGLAGADLDAASVTAPAKRRVPGELDLVPAGAACPNGHEPAVGARDALIGAPGPRGVAGSGSAEGGSVGVLRVAGVASSDAIGGGATGDFTDPARDAERVEAAGPTSLRVRGRILAGSLLFIAGFTTVFTVTNVLAANLLGHERAAEVIVGVFVIVLGAAFIGWIPGMQREFRIQKLPAAGLLGAPVLGAVFALSWVPCATPTLGAVLGLSMVGGETGRAVTLTIAYCAGLGLPFLAFGLGYRRLLGVFKAVRRNSRWVTRIGGVLLIVIGLALVTGGWTDFVNWLRATVGAGQVGI
jgi:cytochrome c-type biogenesis protein